MKNFPTYFFKRIGEHKQGIAFVRAVDGALETTATRAWTLGVQKIGIALLEMGFEPGTRVGFVAYNCQEWLDVAMAVWLVGGVVVPLPTGRDRKETLRCLGRSGATWVVVDGESRLKEIRGQGDKLPPLQWISLEKKKASRGDDVVDLDHLLERGRYRGKRGDLNLLAERSFGLAADDPALVLFPYNSDDPHGAYFSGAKLAVMLEALAGDLMLDDTDTVAVLLSHGWFYGLLFSLAAMLEGARLAEAQSLTDLADNLDVLMPTVLACGPAFIEGQTLHWREQLEATQDLFADEDDKVFSLKRAFAKVGERGMKRLILEPAKSELGGELKRVFLVDGHLPDEVRDVLGQVGAEVLGMFGVEEAGITHVERQGSQKHGSVGRPVQGIACKVDSGKEGEPGQILVRSDVLFDGYWDDAGPREIVDDWLHTGIDGRLSGGYLVLTPE